MTDAQLKPCPFCGGDAKHVIDHTTECVDQLYCTSCFASITDRDKHGDCITLWNARASLSPVVKPLEWDRHPDEQEWYAKLSEIEGDTFERGYMILPTPSHFTLYDGFGNRKRVLGHYTLATEAKAAAQADYAKRILSALTFTPSDKDKEIERLREALKEAGDYLEAYKVNTQIDLGDASDMPFVDDTLKKIDAALEERG